MMADDLITIASFRDPVGAHIAKGKLESEGIEAYLANDILWSADPGCILADGGVHLRVRESDAVEARKALDVSRD